MSAHANQNLAGPQLVCDRGPGLLRGPGPQSAALPGSACAGGRVNLITTVLTRARTVLPRGILGDGGREKEKCPLAYSHGGAAYEQVEGSW